MFIFAEDLQERGPTDDFWYQPVGFRAGGSSKSVTPDRSMILPAVYACVRVITDAVMQIPLILYQREGERGEDKSRAINDPRYSLLHDQPNERFTAPEWREIMQHHTLLRGNSYAEKVEGRSGGLESLGDPWHPDLVEAKRFRDSVGRMRMRYTFKGRFTDEVDRVLDGDQVLHIRGLTLDGVTGMSPIETEREAVGVGLAAQEFMGRYFENDARPGGVVEMEGSFKTQKQREEFRANFQAAQTGKNRHKTAVLEYGMSYKPLELRLVDQQFLELRKYQNHEIARIFRVPPHMIMEMDRSTFSNIEHQSIGFVKNTMLPWLVRWEKRLNASLLGAESDEGLFFEFLVDGLERGDIKGRTAYYQSGIQNGYMTRNEVRRKENMNALEGLDEPLEPMNMQGANEVENDEDERPPATDRTEALEINAARAVAKKHANQLRRALARTDARPPAKYLAERVEDVAEMMALPLDSARAIISDAIADIDAVGSVDEWESRQMDRLLEASRAL